MVIMLFDRMSSFNPCEEIEIPRYKFTNKQIGILEENGFVIPDEIPQRFEKRIMLEIGLLYISFYPGIRSSVTTYNNKNYKKVFQFDIDSSVKIEDILENIDLICNEIIIHSYLYRIASFEYNSRHMTVLVSVLAPVDKDGIIMVIDNGFHVYKDNKLSVDEVIYLHTQKINKDQR